MYFKQLWDSDYDQIFDFDLKVEDILFEVNYVRISCNKNSPLYQLPIDRL
jgi:hypothetical protein